MFLLKISHVCDTVNKGNQRFLNNIIKHKNTHIQCTLIMKFAVSLKVLIHLQMRSCIIYIRIFISELLWFCLNVLIHLQMRSCIIYIRIFISELLPFCLNVLIHLQMRSCIIHIHIFISESRLFSDQTTLKTMDSCFLTFSTKTIISHIT
jgi:hypothetical protein